jgi:hypothetical protein
MPLQVANRSENIVFKGGIVEVRLARPGRAAESTEIDCEDAESLGNQSPGLIPPAFLVESAAVSEHNSTVALAKEIGTNSSTIFGWDRDVLLGNQFGQYKGEGQGSKGLHARIIQRPAHALIRWK